MTTLDSGRILKMDRGLIEMTDKVKRVYSGRPGCGCGCRGKYWTDSRNIRRVLKAMRDSLIVAERFGIDDEKIAWVKTTTRYFWAYIE